MQNRDDHDAVFAKVIEERVRKAAEEYAAERPVGLMKREWMPLCEGDRFIDGGNEVVAEIG